MGALSDAAFSTKFTDAFAYAQKGTAIRSMLKPFKFLHRDKKWWEACKLITDYADQHVKKALQRLRERKESDTGPLRLVDEMARDTQDKLTLRSHIISAFSPAHDGAAITLSNAMFHIARHPDVWEELRREIEATKDEPLSYALLNSYKYLSQVLKESKSATIPMAPVTRGH